jgi:hypothetical protein
MYVHSGLLHFKLFQNFFSGFDLSLKILRFLGTTTDFGEREKIGGRALFNLF